MRNNSIFLSEYFTQNFCSKKTFTFLCPRSLHPTHYTTLVLLILRPHFGFSAFPTSHLDGRHWTEIPARHAIVYIVGLETNDNIKNADCRSSRGSMSNENKIVFTNPLAMNVITEVQLACLFFYSRKSAFPLLQHLSRERKMAREKLRWRERKFCSKTDGLFTFNTNTSALYL